MANLVSTRLKKRIRGLREASWVQHITNSPEERLEKNPRSPNVPEIRIVTADKCPHPWEGSDRSLYDFIDDESVALLLNCPGEVSWPIGDSSMIRLFF